MTLSPLLIRRESDGLAWWTDPAASEAGVLVAFSERSGGTSAAPYASLNLGAHVGDDPDAVDRNRAALLRALGLESLVDRLVMAEQVHGERMTVVDAADQGAGGRASRRVGEGAWLPPVAATDAVITSERNLPLLMCFADCVPVILAGPGPVVAVVHAGWRGALASLPGSAASALAARAGVTTASLTAWVGPHIGPCHYEVDYEILSQFVNRFGTLSRAESGGLDLGATVRTSLTDAGVPECSIASLGACTAEETDRFFSYRAEGGLTGRHGALACIL